MKIWQENQCMRFLLALLITILLTKTAAANTISEWTSFFGAKGLRLKTSKTAKLNSRNRWNLVVKIKEHNLARQLAKISQKSAREEAYIHLSNTLAVETGKNERFRVFSSNCLVRATVQSSITIDDLISAQSALPSKIIWYHVHPSRSVIDAQFRRSRCKPPHTWPILPSSADISWFLERARKYYAARPDGSYLDRIVVHPLGAIELSLTDKGKAVVDQFKWVKNYTTQVSGNDSMPGYRVLPQRIIQILGAKIDRFKKPGAALEEEIHLSVRRLSTSVLTIRFIPMRNF